MLIICPIGWLAVGVAFELQCLRNCTLSSCFYAELLEYKRASQCCVFKTFIYHDAHDMTITKKLATQQAVINGYNCVVASLSSRAVETGCKKTYVLGL